MSEVNPYAAPLGEPAYAGKQDHSLACWRDRKILIYGKGRSTAADLRKEQPTCRTALTPETGVAQFDDIPALAVQYFDFRCRRDYLPKEGRHRDWA